MIKTAIFVEGQTELIIVREFLLKWFDYGISLNCFNLFKRGGSNSGRVRIPKSKRCKIFSNN